MSKRNVELKKRWLEELEKFPRETLVSAFEDIVEKMLREYSADVEKICDKVFERYGIPIDCDEVYDRDGDEHYAHLRYPRVWEKSTPNEEREDG